jgi:hypothetical protein
MLPRGPISNTLRRLPSVLSYAEVSDAQAQCAVLADELLQVACDIQAASAFLAA